MISMLENEPMPMATPSPLASIIDPKTLVFDIETGPLPLAGLEAMMPEFEAPGNYKDPEKIASAIAEKQAAWLERAALSPVTGRVLAIGGEADGQAFQIINSDEALLLHLFWSIISRRTRLVGFCSHKFDLPFLLRRSWRHDIAFPDIVGPRGYFENSVDLAEVWQCGDRTESISLDRLAKHLGVGKKSGNGKDFAQLLETDRESAIAYLAHDVELTRKCAERLGVI
ncbi:MAG: hypothetical protein V4733_03635 [Verrucomicrobiota bacterium]